MSAELGDNPLGIILFLAALSLLPLLLMICTAFLKISMVLIITRNAIGVQQVPPNMAMYAVALAATLFVMAPVAYQVHDNIKNHPIEITTAEETLRGVGQAGAPLQKFMMKNTAPEIARHLLESARQLWPKELSNRAREDNFLIVVPAFVLSELQAGFKIGFLIYIPFVVIDLIISNLLLALGMQMVSPMTISLPLKLLLFVLVEGWTRLLDSLFYSYL